MPKNTKTDSSGNSVPALRRTVEILDAVSNSASPLMFTDIALMLGFPKSSAHGLCTTLLELRLLNCTDAGVYRLVHIP